MMGPTCPRRRSCSVTRSNPTRHLPTSCGGASRGRAPSLPCSQAHLTAPPRALVATTTAQRAGSKDYPLKLLARGDDFTDATKLSNGLEEPALLSSYRTSAH